jgi:small subunit ribosomal protein S4
MGRYRDAVCRLCRREQTKLFLKGDRCYSAKCAIERGRPVPGAQSGRRRKPSEYAEQLRAKQSLRRHYSLTEKQFHLTFQRATRAHGVTGEILLQLLELRLDNAVFRLGLAPSRAAARQMVRHGHVLVNQRRVNIPSYTLKPGDVIRVKDSPVSRQMAQRARASTESRGTPGWMSLNTDLFQAEVLRAPERDEIQPVANEQRVVELYSK